MLCASLKSDDYINNPIHQQWIAQMPPTAYDPTLTGP